MESAIAVFGVTVWAILSMFFVFVFIPMVVVNLVRESTKPSTKTDMIAETIGRLRGLNFEVEVVLNGDGGIFSETTQYDAEFVQQTDEQVRLFRENGNLISIHNHIDDTPPSVQDISYVAMANFAQVIVVTPKKVYRILRPEAGWKTQNDIVEAVNQRVDLFEKRRVGEPTIVAVESDGAVVEAVDYAFVSTDEALEAVCQDLGYELLKEEVEKS